MQIGNVTEAATFKKFAIFEEATFRYLLPLQRHI